jgi:hypothetical protein
MISRSKWSILHALARSLSTLQELWYSSWINVILYYFFLNQLSDVPWHSVHRIPARRKLLCTLAWINVMTTLLKMKGVLID